MSPPRIIAGAYRNRRLRVPEGFAVRPTAERTREALFDILASQDRVQGALVLDLFAGTGAVGLEALSRGAAFALFVESDPVAARCLEANVKALGETGRARVVVGNAARPGLTATRFDLVYLDPPYRSDLGIEALASLRRGPWLATGALLVWERGKDTAPPPAGYAIVDERRYGRAHLIFLQAA